MMPDNLEDLVHSEPVHNFHRFQDLNILQVLWLPILSMNQRD